MKALRLQSLMLGAALAIAFAVAAHTEDREPPAVSKQAPQAKIEYCKTCHGVSGQGFRGAFPMPRLAGQQPEYLENQLRAFIERRRKNPIMFNVAHVLNSGMVSALATHFHNLDPRPLGGAPTALV